MVIIGNSKGNPEYSSESHAPRSRDTAPRNLRPWPKSRTSHRFDTLSTSDRRSREIGRRYWPWCPEACWQDLLGLWLKLCSLSKVLDIHSLRASENRIVESFVGHGWSCNHSHCGSSTLEYRPYLSSRTKPRVNDKLKKDQIHGLFKLCEISKVVNEPVFSLVHWAFRNLLFSQFWTHIGNDKSSSQGFRAVFM